MIEVKNVIRVYDEPTAASAFLPTNCPTINVSTMLYNCCNKSPIIMGTAKRNIDDVIFPLVKHFSM
jgi:hypothetical protein